MGEHSIFTSKTQNFFALFFILIFLSLCATYYKYIELESYEIYLLDEEGLIEWFAEPIEEI